MHEQTNRGTNGRPPSASATPKCCTCKRVWINEASAAAWLAEQHPSRRVQVVDLAETTLKAIIAVLDRTAVAITLHGSASYNSPFLHYSSVMLELWPVGYFGSGDTIQKENIAASGGVTYLKAGALKGNLKGHDAWTFVPVDTQLGPLVQLALNISSNIKQPYIIH